MSDTHHGRAQTPLAAHTPPRAPMLSAAPPQPVHDWVPGKFARAWDQLVWDVDDRPDGTVDLYCMADRIAGADRILTGEGLRALGKKLHRSPNWVRPRLAWLVARSYVELVEAARPRHPARYRLTDAGALGIMPGYPGTNSRAQTRETGPNSRAQTRVNGRTRAPRRASSAPVLISLET